MRDKLAWWLCTFVMQNIATSDYAARISLMVQYGLRRIAEDTGETESYDNFWTPTDEERWKMFGSFLSKDEGMVLTTGSKIVYIASDEKMESVLDEKKEGS